MESARESKQSGSLAQAVGMSDAATFTWNFIGPEPITEKSNFTGTVFGSDLCRHPGG